MSTVADFCETVDRGFNILGYIPLVSSITGPIRSGIWGTGQLFIGLIGLPISLLVALFSGGSWSHVFWFWAALIVNGVLNMIRGTIEAVPLLGNLIVFLYDRIRGGVEIMAYR
jgi:hypothetical protein